MQTGWGKQQRMRTTLFETVFMFHNHLLHVTQCVSIPLEPGKRTAIFRSECSVNPPRPSQQLQPLSRGAKTVQVHVRTSLSSPCVTHTEVCMTGSEIKTGKMPKRIIDNFITSKVISNTVYTSNQTNGTQFNKIWFV